MTMRACARIDGLLIIRMRRRRCAKHVGPCTSAWINKICSDQLIHCRLINLRPLGLHIRAIWATHIGPLIPVQAEPFEIFQGLTCGIVAGSGQVQIFHPKHDLAVVAAGDQPGHQKSTGISQMEPTRRRWGEPADGR